MANRVKVKGSASTANQYLNKKSGEQFYYASYYMSTVYSIVLTVLTILSWRDCEIDPQYANPNNTLLGDNLFNNPYCRLTMTQSQIYCNTIMGGIMIFDICYQTFLVSDFKSGAAKENYIHHFLALSGVLHGLYYGRFWGMLSSAALVTEISTPFVNLRYMLYTHKKVDS